MPQALVPDIIQLKAKFRLHNLDCKIIGIRVAHELRDYEKAVGAFLRKLSPVSYLNPYRLQDPVRGMVVATSNSLTFQSTLPTFVSLVGGLFGANSEYAVKIDKITNRL